VASTAFAGTVTGPLQGPSGLPVKNATLTFQLQQSGLLVGTGNIAQLTSQCYTSTDGTVVGLPNPLQFPTTTTSVTSTLPSGIYFIEYTFYNSAGESLPSPEFRIQTVTLQSILVSPPVSFPANATGIKVYIGTASGAETLQGTTTSATAQYTQSVPLVTGANPPGSNTSPCTIAFNDTIIPYQGYNVSLTSSSGNAYPGWPQAWQLNGGLSGTVNVSAGAPLWNGTVIYPMPILSQPLNHGPQSISGPLDFGGYNVTNMGNTTSCSVNGTVNVESSCFASYLDLGAKVTAALASCGSQCELYIPAGSYSYTTSISLPLNIFGTYKLTGSPGTVISYTGTNDAIVTPIGTNGPGDSQLIIEGFQVNGTASATSGIHTYPTNRITIRNMLIQGFAAGDGIRVEGTNSSNIYDNLITNNLNGIHLIPTICNASYPYTCSSTGSGPNIFTPNAMHIHDNQIVVNSNWCIWNDRNSNPGGLTGSLNNSYRDNDLEHCGTSPNGGSIYDMHSRGTIIDGNYFEASPHQIVLGEAGAGSALNTAGANVINNYFTTSPPIAPATKQYEIELQNVVDTRMEGNSELGTAGIGGATNCFINSLVGGETRTFLGRNAIFQNSTDGSGNQICSAGAGVLTFLGAGSTTLRALGFLGYMGDQFFQINTAVTTESVGIQTMTINGSCQLARSTGDSAAINAGATSILANTSKVTAVSAGGITVVHPSGTAMTYDIICEDNPTGSYGFP